MIAVRFLRLRYHINIVRCYRMGFGQCHAAASYFTDMYSWETYAIHTAGFPGYNDVIL